MRILLIICLIIGSILFLAGALFKLESWEGASTMLLSGIGLLLTPVAIGSRKLINELLTSKMKNKGLLLVTLCVFVISTLLTLAGAVFKLESWEGASEMLIVGEVCFFISIILAIITVIWSMIFGEKNKPL
jgi:membrane protease YdiL (CAAX protease family)